MANRGWGFDSRSIGLFGEPRQPDNFPGAPATREEPSGLTSTISACLRSAMTVLSPACVVVPFMIRSAVATDGVFNAVPENK